MDSDRRDHPSRGRSGSGLTARPLPPVVGAQAVLETDEAKVCVCARGVLRHDTGDGTVCRCRDTAIRNAPGTRSNTAERTEGADAFGAVGHSAELWCSCVCAGCVVDRCVGHSSRHTTRPAPNITMSCLEKDIVSNTPPTHCSSTGLVSGASPAVVRRAGCAGNRRSQGVCASVRRSPTHKHRHKTGVVCPTPTQHRRK